MTPPMYMRVLPEEVKRYKGNAAIVLAHIRFRCSGPDGIERDGFRWWRVSRGDLGREVGLSAQEVKGALRKLGDAVVAANNCDDPQDQTRAYRPADASTCQKFVSPRSDAADDDASTCQKFVSHRSDAADDDSDPDRGQMNPVPGSNEPGTGVERPSALPTRETKEKEQEPPYPPSAEASPAAHTNPANEAGEQSNLPDVIDAEIVPEERGQERGRSNPVDVSASRLVSMLIPANTPTAVKTALRLKASELIRGDGLPPEVVAEALRRWQARPDAGVGLLPYIASEVLREGTAPAPKSKLRTAFEFSKRLGEIEREYLERHPDGAGLNEHLAAVIARESGPAPTSKARTVAEWAREAREAELQGTGPAPRSKQRDWANLTAELAEEARAAETARAAEPEPPRAIEAKAAPNPRPAPPQWVPGPEGSPRCRRHAHLRLMPDCDECRRAAEAAAGEAS